MVYLWRWLWREGGTSHKNPTEPFANTKCETDTGGHLAGCTGRLQILVITPWRFMPPSHTFLERSVLMQVSMPGLQFGQLSESESYSRRVCSSVCQPVGVWGLRSGFLRVQILHLQSLYHLFICGVIYWSLIHPVSIFLRAMIKYRVENTMAHSIQYWANRKHSCYCHPEIYVEV